MLLNLCMHSGLLKFSTFSQLLKAEISFSQYGENGISGLIDGSTVLPPANPFEEIMATNFYS